MGDNWPFVVLAVVLGLAIWAFRVSQRRRKDYREIIEPELERLGFEFVCSTTPRLFDMGPFPKIRFEVGGTRTRTPIGSGEFSEYRIVRYKKPGNPEEFESWVELDFEAFKHRRSTWMPELDQTAEQGLV